MRNATQYILPIATAIAAWELMTRWEEAQTIGETGANYWRNYFPPEVGQRADRIRETHAIRSTGVTLHIDVYPQSDSGAPVAVFNHGGGSYSRLATKLCLSLHERGYIVVAADQKGQGFSGGERGFGTFRESVQNAVDIARWAKTRFGTPVFMLGGSLGGPTTYYAAAAGAPITAIACLNLYDFTPDNLDIAEIFGQHIATLMYLYPLFKPFGWLRLPWKLLTFWDEIFDDREQDKMALWRNDPIPLSHVSLRFLHSLVSTVPSVPFEQNVTPALVINQARDKMTAPHITERNFQRLGGPKDYVEVPFGHYSFTDEMNELVVDASDRWFKQHLSTI